ncbi:unnamed protein product [Absidia cylindrospora]
MQKSPLSHHQTSSTKTPYTMSSSASITPQQVEPSMTIKTKSSFSEIEQLVDPHHTSKNYSYGTSQLQLNKQTEPFVSPLTETNLNYHKSTFPPSREAKQRYVDFFIQNQKALLEQELDLQRRTKAEIQSMIPLDTKSIDEELVRDDQQHLNDFARSLAQSPRSRMSSSTSLGTPQRRHSALVQHRYSSHHDEQDLTLLATTESEQHSTPQVDNGTKLQASGSSKKPWMKALTRWILPGQTKKEDGYDCNDNGQQQQQQPVTTVAVEVASSSIQQENENLGVHVDPSLSSSSVLASASAPAPTPVPASVSASVSAPVSATEAGQFHDPYRQTNRRQARRAARHVSWSGGTSFEKYKQQKSSMIEEGLYGLSNANIARALGSSQQGSRAPLLFLPTRNTTTSSSYTNDAVSLEATTPEPATTTPELHDTPDSHTLSSTSTNQKKDPAISFVQQTLSSAKSLLRPRKSIRKKSNHVDPQETPQPPTVNSSNDRDGHDDGGGGGGGGITLTDSQVDAIQQQQQQEKERRRRSTLATGRYSPSLSALKEEEWVGMPESCQHLVAFRYPKMVRIKDLRDAAIHILSTSDGDADEMDYMTVTGHRFSNGGTDLLAQNKPTWNTGQDLYGDDYDEDLNRCARKYRNSMKRLSDPGTGLSPPPFSIGRPISSLHN